MSPEAGVSKKNVEKSAKKEKTLPPIAPQSPPPEPTVPPEQKSMSARLFFVGLLFIIICYFVPCAFNALFAIIGVSQPTLANYLGSIDRPLAIASLVLSVISLVKGMKSDAMSSETAKLIQDMQRIVTGLDWKIDAANTILNGMYTEKSESEKTQAYAVETPRVGWDRDTVRKVEADEYTPHRAKDA